MKYYQHTLMAQEISEYMQIDAAHNCKTLFLRVCFLLTRIRVCVYLQILLAHIKDLFGEFIQVSSVA